MKQRLALLGISLLAFTVYLDFTIVSTALPSIQKDLSANVIQLQWMMNILFLGLCVFMTAMGRVADIYGRRKLLFIGVIVFGLASLGAGLSVSPLMLIFFRGLQGISAAITLPVAAALIPTLVPEGEQSRAFGFYGMITGAGLAAGPFLGGVIISVVSWRWIFLINVPIVIMGILLCIGRVAESRSAEQGAKIDWWGVLFLGLSVCGIVLGVIQGENAGWLALSTIASFIIGVISLVTLIIVERKVRMPIIDFQFFKNPAFLGSLIAMFAAGWFMAVIFFINPLYLGNILNETPFMVGMMLFAITVMEILATFVTGRLLANHSAKRAILASLICLIIAAIVHSFFGVDSMKWLIILAFIPYGLAWGMMNVAPMVAVSQAIKPEKVGLAFGTLFPLYNLGASIGLAIGVVMFRSSEKSDLMRNLATQNIELTKKQTDLIQSLLANPDHAKQILSQFTGTLGDQIMPLFKHAFMQGFHSAVGLLFWLSLAAIISVFFVFRRQGTQ